MARTKGSKNKTTETLPVPVSTAESFGNNELTLPILITLLSVDYGREDLNTMAKKINELIESHNASFS